MKLKFLIILLAAILIPGMASAQTFYKLGYCNGKVASEGNLEVDGAVAIEIGRASCRERVYVSV